MQKFSWGFVTPSLINSTTVQCLFIFSIIDQDSSDGFIISQAVSASLKHRHITTISGTLGSNLSQPFNQQPTEWAYGMDKIKCHSIFTLLFLLHLSTLIIGSVVIIPLFFQLDIHLGKILTSPLVCYPALFWFSFLTLILEYLMIFIFTICFGHGIRSETPEFLQNLDRSN